MNDKIVLGDCLEVMKDLPDDCVDAIVTDPPAGISFMSASWDSDKGGRLQWVAWMGSVARECLRIMKPGGYALVWALPRTSHWTGWAWENAGWEPRDKIIHLFGCLSEDTEILINDRWEPYQKAVVGSLALCYDVEHDTFAQHEIQETYCYPYEDTAFRIQSDRTDQIVSRGHRCLVERDGKFSFAYAETLMDEENVPILENLQGLLTALCLSDEGAGSPQQDVPWVQPQANVVGEEGEVPCTTGSVSKMQQGIPPQEPPTYGQGEVLLQHLQSAISDAGPCSSGKNDRDSQARTCRVDGGESEIRQREDGRPTQSSVEGRGGDLQEARELRGGAVRSVPAGVPADGAEGRLCNRAPSNRGEGAGSLSPSCRDGASRGPQPDEQRSGELGVVQVESGPQAVRASRFTTSDLARITPFHLTGKVWCVKVPTGAFVARRNGKVFITGNSGFPKSLDVSKAIDKAAGVERMQGPVDSARAGRLVNQAGDYSTDAGWSAGNRKVTIDPPATDAARQWNGWGTALKPAAEDWWLFRKPLSEKTVAANVLKHGTGGINIDGCRIETGGEYLGRDNKVGDNGWKNSSGGKNSQALRQDQGLPPQGRWPANVIFECTCDETLAGPLETVSDRVGESSKATRYTERGATNIAATPGARRSGGGVIHTNPECPAALLDEQTGTLTSGKMKAGTPRSTRQGNAFGEQPKTTKHDTIADSGTASRFFYCAKASRSERTHGGTVTNSHPTVKPIALMRYLVRLVTPTGGSVLDPFCGSGSTPVAAELEGFDYLGIEQDPESHRTACDRVAHAEMLRKKTDPKTKRVATDEETP